MQARMRETIGCLTLMLLSPAFARAQGLPDAGVPPPEPVIAEPAKAAPSAAPAEAPPSQPESTKPSSPSGPTEGTNATPPAEAAAPTPPPAQAPTAAVPPPPAMPPSAPPMARENVTPPLEPVFATEERDAKQLYLRLGAGFGFPFGPDVADRYDDRSGNALHFSGYGLALDVMAGAALWRGLVIGGGAISDMIAGGTVRTSDDAHRNLANSLYYTVIGGFADYYTSPPAGLHVQALLGMARLSLATDLGHDAAYGFGAVLGIGYEWATGRRWNLGALARVALSPMGMPSVAHQKPSPTVYEPSLLWTATFRPE